MEIIFWLSLFVVFYTFLGYGIVLYLLVRIRRLFKGKRMAPGLDQDFPTLTLVIAAYNEESIIEEKIADTLRLSYPEGKLKLIFVTDGSSDRTPELVGRYPQIKLMHTPVRSGKILAMHRAMDEVDTEVVVFTDANTFLNKEALLLIARHYADASVGAVSGEKRVMQDALSDATAGEGFYWKYESTLKKWDSELYSVVGAAGELFSVRRSLYRPVEPDTILDDFMISMQIAEKGYRIVYEPDAYASELSSENIKEELKRKVRIAAGGIQSIFRLKRLLNPFHDPLLSFQYISHRVLRWTVTPFLMILALVLNMIIVARSGGVIYQLLLVAQGTFYLLALAGWVLERQKIKIKALFVPYYFCMMNYAVVAGIRRYFKGSQSAAWEKAKRKSA
ncbi:glycosyltransferase family 2 protein [Dyadobacter sp. OTU695]|uniref:glycosyltransferase family 2 protein n=1 Tax=Dyadobacter sp. OTU695 TaxID=3043860 RepID=UPI00313D3069